MARKQESFREKLADDKDLPRVQPISGEMLEKFGGGTILLPAPREVDELMRAVPEGKLTTINRIRVELPDAPGGPTLAAGIRLRRGPE